MQKVNWSRKYDLPIVSRFRYGRDEESCAELQMQGELKWDVLVLDLATHPVHPKILDL